MGRKNKRRYIKPVGSLDALKREVRQNARKGEDTSDGRCAYCGRRIYPGGWHWMYDEWGQQVKKCNAESACRRKRARTWGQEESYRKAMRRWNS